MSLIPQNRLLILFIALLLGTTAAVAEEEVAAEPKPGYVSLGKSMVLNLSSGGKRLTFLQLAADVLVKNDDAKAVVESHIPAIRHKLVVMLSEQPAADLKSPVKREEIRKQITEGVRNMIEEMTDNKDIEEVLFTTFLVQ